MPSGEFRLTSVFRIISNSPVAAALPREGFYGKRRAAVFEFHPANLYPLAHLINLSICNKFAIRKEEKSR